MSMRKCLAQTLFQIQSHNEKALVLLGDIGVFGFQKSFQEFPERTINMGILEQSTVGVAAGFARAGFIPVVHTIAPFLVERAFEQIKIDFAYQSLSGKFVSVGGSYDYAALGCTHHCPGDITILKSIPDVDLIVPGTAEEFSTLMQSLFSNGRSTYFRLSEFENRKSQVVHANKANVIKQGRDATVVVVGPFLDRVLEATSDWDMSIVYYTTLAPFDGATLRAATSSRKLFVVAPFYEGTITHDIMTAFRDKPITLHDLSIPRLFLRRYGHRSQHDEALGLTPAALRERIRSILQASPSLSYRQELAP